jgi:molecular chaperone DnaJ
VAQADLYQVLGVSKTASPDEIKKAYRKRAKEFHPDVNPGDKRAEDKFKEASAAFEVLSDPEKRKVYDELGPDAAKINYDPEKARQYRQWQQQQTSRGSSRSGRAGAGGFDFDFGSAEAGGQGGEGFDFSDIFGEIFGNRRGGRATSTGPQASRPRRRPTESEGGDDAEAEVEIDLREAVQGATRQLTVNRPTACASCRGTGAKNAKFNTCPTCKGTGQAQSKRGGVQFATVCPTCGGEGQVSEPCPTCGGSGQVNTTSRLEVKIPAGVDTGSRVRLAGQGNPGVGGGPSGDLYIEVKVRPHPLIKREGDDLEMQLPVTVPEAVLGSEITLPTFDGDLQLKIPAGSQAGKKLRLRGKGVPHLKGGGRGDLYVVLQVLAPDPSEAARSAAEALRKFYPANVRSALKL